MKTILLALISITLTSCDTLNSGNALVGWTGNGIEITGITGDATGVGYDTKLKTAYIVWANGDRETFKITGGGFGAGKVRICLQSGGSITVDTKTGIVTTVHPITPAK